MCRVPFELWEAGLGWELELPTPLQLPSRCWSLCDCPWTDWRQHCTTKKLIKDLLCWRIRVRCTAEWLHLAPTSLLCPQQDAEPPRPSLSWLSHLPDSAPPPAALNTTTPRDNVSTSTTSTDRTDLSRTMWRFLQRSKLKAVCFFSPFSQLTGFSTFT